MIYIFNEYTSSKKNGVGTFIREFIRCIKDIGMNYCILGFNCPVREIVINRNNKVIQEILFPPFITSNFMEYYSIFVKVLRLHIKDCVDNVFLINYTPCKALVQDLKKVYPRSKIVLLIHDLSWTSKLLGDVDAFKLIVKNKELNPTDDNSCIIRRFDNDIETLQMVDYVVCLSMDTYDLMRTIYNVDESRLFLIPNGLHTCYNIDKRTKRQLRKKYHIQNSEYVILFVGRPTRQKGIYSLLQAMDTVLKKYPYARLVIAGQEIYDENRTLLQMFPEMATHVTFLGLLDAVRLYEWYEMADLGVIPSFYEQCTYTGIEMMMHGLPIVISDGFGLRSMFVENQTALFAHIQDRNDLFFFSCNLANSINKLLSSKELRKKLSRNVRQHYEKYYSGEMMKKKYCDLFLSILDNIVS